MTVGTTRSAAVYCRISADREGRELGVQRQEQDCRELAQRLGLTVGEVFVDNDISASTRSRKRRPRFEEMMERAESGEFSALLFYSTSRLTRRPLEYERLISLVDRRRVRLSSVVSGDVNLSTADGRATARTLAAWDAAEAERTAERVSRDVRRRAQEGKWHGGYVPFGYRRLGDRIEPDPVRAELVREAARRVLAGETMYAIARDWNRRGVQSARGGRWLGAALCKTLTSPSMVALRRYDGKLLPTPWAPILDRRTWDRLVDMVSDPSRRRGVSTGAYEGKRALSGIVFCHCGQKLINQVNRGRPRLICHRQATSGCGGTAIPYEPLETFLLDLVLARLDSPSFRSALARRTVTTDGRETELREALSLVERRRLGVADGLEIGAYTRAEAAARVRQLEEERVHIQKELAALSRANVLTGVRNAADARRLWDEADTTRRRRFLGVLVDRVVVEPFPTHMSNTIGHRRRGEDEETYQARKRAHERAVLRERVSISWGR